MLDYDGRDSRASRASVGYWRMTEGQISEWGSGIITKVCVRELLLNIWKEL